MSQKLEYDLSQELPDPVWNHYGSYLSKRSPKVTCLQIQWDGLVGTLDGTIELEISNQVSRSEEEADEFVTKVPLVDSNGDPIALDSASNKSNCHLVMIETPHAAWRLKPSKGGITAGMLKAIMIEPSE